MIVLLQTIVGGWLKTIRAFGHEGTGADTEAGARFK